MEVEGKASDRKYPEADANSKQQRSSATATLTDVQSAASTSSSSPSSLSTASSDVVRSILTFLHPADLRHVFPCSRFLSTYQRDDVLWSFLLTALFLTPRPPLPPGYLPESSPYVLFRQYHAEYPPRYWPHYPAIHSLHQQLRSVLEEKAPWIAQSLSRGASEEEVQRADAALGEGGGEWGGGGQSRLRMSGCVDWLLFLKMTNGQKVRKGERGPGWLGLWGTITFYHTTVNVSSIPTPSHPPLAPSKWPSSDSPSSLCAVQMRLSSLEESVVGFHPMSGFLPISSSPLGDDQLQFFLHPSGQVVRSMKTPHRFHVVAPSFTSFLSTHLQRLQGGLYEIKHPARLPWGAVAGISRFAFPDPCGSDCVTRGIRVQTSALYVSEESGPRSFVFAYRIRMTHTGESRIDATLTSRRWIITHGTGREEVVVGEGVIGLYPVSDGALSHQTSLRPPRCPPHPLCWRCSASLPGLPWCVCSISSLAVRCSSMRAAAPWRRRPAPCEEGQQRRRTLRSRSRHCTERAAAACTADTPPPCCPLLSFFFALARTGEIVEVIVAPMTFDTQRNGC